MKKVKKLFAVLLAAMTVMALSATALAAETFTIRFTDPGFSLFAAGSDDRYAVYQIFTGDLTTDETANVKTLSNIKWGQNAKDHSEGEAVSEEVLNALKAVNVAGKTDKEKLAVITQYVNLDSNPIKKTNGTGDEDLSVKPGYYLIKDNGPVGNGETYNLYVVEVTNNVTITPKTSNTTSEKNIVDGNDKRDSADYDIGDGITFQLSATITKHYDYYETYKLTFHDTLSAGLTLDANSIEVKVDGTKIESNEYTVATDANDKEDTCSFEVQFTDLKKIDSVKAGSTITIEYTATLNENAVIGGAGNPNTLKVSYSNNPYDDADTTDTPGDTVKVYTYKIVVNKVDGDNAPLTGAGFTLYKRDANGTYQAMGDEIKGDTMTTFTFSGLGSGDYQLKETTTPEGYNTIAPIEFTISATYNSNDGSIATLSASTNDDTKFTAETTAGSLTTNVVNNRGSLLPETGGIGTTIFYVLGGVLMVGAVVLLVTRKRMRDAE